MEHTVNRAKQVKILNDNTLDTLEVEHLFNQYGWNKIVQPHEWKFVYMLYRDILIKQQELIYPFLDFYHQYYPNYRFSIPQNSLGAVVVEADLCHMLFTQYYKYKINVNLDKPFQFGEIVTEFMIRYLGYSLIGLSAQKIILTAQSNCEKRFETYLEKDKYTIFRLSKLKYENHRFQKLPILPTRGTYLQFDEYIEDEHGKKHLVLR